MANSKYEYVRGFERDEVLLPNTWIVVRIDGRGFHKLSTHYQFKKPNDARALSLMNHAATHVVTAMPEIIVAYGVSDEYSFVFDRSTDLFDRRSAKLVSTVVSLFTAAYVALWDSHFGDAVVASGASGDSDVEAPLSLSMLPTFDGRAACYPSWDNLRDYLCWRQVDCHINNLYNTTFWALVQQGAMSPTAAEELLKGTVSSDKNEILFSRFGINYNNEPDMFRKGSVLYREYAAESISASGADATAAATGQESPTPLPRAGSDAPRGTGGSKTQAEKMKKARRKALVVTKHVDIIKDDFWSSRPWIQSGKPGRPIPATAE